MEEFSLTGEGVQELMTAILGSDSKHRIRVKGSGYSMIPFIKSSDVIVLKPIDPGRGIKFGDIVAVSCEDKAHIVIHRVIGLKKGYCQTKGDNNPKADPWHALGGVIGMVDNINNSSWIPYSCKHWQNVLIGFASKTGLLNTVIYPGFIYFRNLFR